MSEKNSKKILLLQGPNLNLLGSREPEIYGSKTLADIHEACQEQVKNHEKNLNIKIELVCFQSNFEGELINKIHEAKLKNFDFILINPAGLTHTSIALRDALLAVNLPFIEIHLSNIYKREEFRKHSYISDIAVGLISGLGDSGYGFALSYAIQYLMR
jgi:3-dehydroquinate dehydratase-2